MAYYLTDHAEERLRQRGFHADAAVLTLFRPTPEQMRKLLRRARPRRRRN
jgi:hypothetical protein